ncbi:TPA: hypothetical protein H2W97_004109 [Salmonella enterica]|uniref:hypothetical protein n=1 Tax=Enterobacter roggenkampii TaxID=1812935 RepID=UPI0019898DAA|nr:hypothetical protein [Salmonella enterica subsp. enterica serovar Orion]HAK7475040.1 hypothetical protein [Salmonella enterica]HAK8236215.1 hypothetical protein [Salmonella enterica]HAK8531624.1 hypothetical protein [Salmonella enterica]HAK8549981.1 hypothetical protein [Salmonella enterica]
MKQGPAVLLLPLLLLLSGCTGSNRPDATRHITQLEITVWPLKTQRDGTTAPDFSVPETWKLGLPDDRRAYLTLSSLDDDVKPSAGSSRASAVNLVIESRDRSPKGHTLDVTLSEFCLKFTDFSVADSGTVRMPSPVIPKTKKTLVTGVHPASPLRIQASNNDCPSTLLVQVTSLD